MSTVPSGENSGSPHANGGTKRKAEEQQTSPSSKRPSKEQKTLEETMKLAGDGGRGVDADMEQEDVKDNAAAEPEPVQKEDGDQPIDVQMGESESTGEKDGVKADEERVENEDTKDGTSASEPTQKNDSDRPNDTKVESKNTGEKSALADVGDEGKTSKQVDDSNDASTTNGGAEGTAVEEDPQRAAAQPSNVLEKGIIYFFTRGRVGTDDPDSVQDLARSFFVLRPLPPGAKLTDGAIPDVGNNRLIALPKKVFPRTGQDKFMAFVEKEKTGMDALKAEFFSGSESSTPTTGTRHTPLITPVGEGVYAFTRTGGATHLAYMLTIPSELGDVQRDLGLGDRGSFVLSVKNPESSTPANGSLPQTAEFSRALLDAFGGRGWMPAEPTHLDHVNCAFLMIGEEFDASDDLEAAGRGVKGGEKETAGEELEKLEDEDEHRVERLRGDDTVFVDLGISSKEYPKVLTTW